MAAFPHRAEGKTDLAAAPRRVLLVTLQGVIVLLVGVPIVAITRPFLRGFTGPLIVLALLGVLGVAFWRSATNLQGHVRAGAQVFMEALAAQSHAKAPGPEPKALEQVQVMLPRLATPTPVRLEEASPAVGKSLAELNLRGLTGATALAIHRAGEDVSIPTAWEELKAGVVLALAGTHAAVEAAKALLTPAVAKAGDQPVGPSPA